MDEAAYDFDDVRHVDDRAVLVHVEVGRAAVGEFAVAELDALINLD